MKGPPSPPSSVIVAIPACNEAEEIAPCLAALAAQRGGRIDGVVICLNNCTDDSARVAQRAAASLPFAVEAPHVDLPPERAFASVARRIAMERAAEIAGPRGVLLTTDADGRVAPDWVAANLAALARGAEAVAGQADIEPQGARLIPAHLHAADAEECAYAALLDEIGAILDPDPADPWPRHDEHSGASIAVTVAAYERAGGMPAVPLGEDRAFFAELRRVDARIRHAPEVRVVVSARVAGRAPGGMADTMRRRMERMDAFLDERLECVADAVRRASFRACLRRSWIHAAPPKARYFGTLWAEVEATNPALRRRPVPVSAVRAQTALAVALRDDLRAAFRPEGPDGIVFPGAAAAD